MVEILIEVTTIFIASVIYESIRWIYRSQLSQLGHYFKVTYINRDGNINFKIIIKKIQLLKKIYHPTTKFIINKQISGYLNDF